MKYVDFIKKYGNEEPLKCYAECVTVNKCNTCEDPDKAECPFKILLDMLNDIRIL